MTRIACLILLSVFSLNILATTPKNGMVVTEHNLASKAGADILAQGGNAIDAAVAVGYALAVVNPCCGNIGGGGFMTIHLADGKNIFLNFREKAPLKAYKTMFLDSNGKVIRNKSVMGYQAVGVPGTVLGLETALKKYGSMTRAQVMTPAIKLARDGFTISPYLAEQLKPFEKDFQAQPNIAAIFLKDGKTLPAGARLVQTELANTLQLIADQGWPVFYKGSIAKSIVAASNANNGLLSMKDFATYNVQLLQPIQCHYRGYTVLSAPPPSAGGITLCESLNILENFPLSSFGFHSIASGQTLIETMRYAFADRNSKLGDPDFVQNPTQHLLSQAYAKEVSEKIKKKIDDITIKNPSTREHTQTTHYSVVDRKGNAVAVTYTLNGYYGAEVIAQQTGFFLNNEMDDFAASATTPNKFGLVQSNKNSIQPGKRPLSSMTPTIVLKDNHLFMVLGSPGGPRIITSVLQTIINVIDYQMPLSTAVSAPRIHYQVLPDLVFLEPNVFQPDQKAHLKSHGYRFMTQIKWSSVEAILMKPDGEAIGFSDPRRPDGLAISDQKDPEPN